MERRYSLVCFITLVLIGVIFLPFSQAVDYGTYSGDRYVSSNMEFQISLPGGDEAMPELIYLNLSKNEVVRWNIETDRGYFQVYFIEGHKSLVTLFLGSSGKTLFQYDTRYSKSTDTMSFSESYKNRDDNGKITLLLMNEKNMDTVVNVKITFTDGSFSITSCLCILAGPAISLIILSILAVFFIHQKKKKEQRLEEKKRELMIKKGLDPDSPPPYDPKGQVEGEYDPFAKSERDLTSGIYRR